MSKQQEYDVGFHGTPLLYSWLIAVNIAVLIAALRWSSYSFYIHLFIALTVILFTLLGTVHILVDAWITPNESNELQKIHNIVGVILVFWIGLQIITGTLTRLAKRSDKISPKLCIWIRKIHMISSYTIMLMSKYNYIGIKFVKGKFKPKFILYLSIDLVFLGIYLMIKYKYLSISQTIVNKNITKKQINQQNLLKLYYEMIKQFILQFRQKNPLKQLKQHLIPKQNNINIIRSSNEILLQNYVIFNDYVYDTTNLIKVHPGGQYLRKITNKRQIDRFLYGFYSPEILKDNITYKHTKDSLRICGYPFAKIQRSTPIKSMKSLNNSKIVQITKISNQSNIYLIKLKLIQTNKKIYQNEQLKFQGYNKFKQFGQYFTLSIVNQKDQVICTRLYTNIWSLRNSNIEFIEKYFNVNLNTNSVKRISIKKQTQQVLINESLVQIQPKSYDKSQQIIPLIIKHYKNGEFTQKLFNQDFNKKLIISHPLGKGLQFDKIKQQGKVIIICGGTGVLPFCDFIDILFKRVKYINNNNISNILAERDPIVKKDLIIKRQFYLYLAVDYVNDIPSLLLYQINQLSKSSQISFNVTLRVNYQVPKQFEQKFCPSIFMTKQFFSGFIKDHIRYQQKIAKIYICGPKLLMYSIGKLLEDQQISQKIYQFI